MRVIRVSGRLYIALVAFLVVAVALASPAPAQEPDPQPDPEMAPLDAAEDDPVEENVDEQPVDEGEENDALEAEWQGTPMADDEDWAIDLPDDETDDAIPVDEELDPASEDWEVTEFVDDGDGREEAPDSTTTDFSDSGDMPTVRKPRRTGPPPKPDEDVPYSTGGKPIRDRGAPWQAQIFYPHSAAQWAEKLETGTPLWQLQHYCGGTLIANDWVLTAAHCIDEDMVKSGYRVRLGAQDISKDDGTTFKIDRIVRHSKYDSKLLPASPNMYANDIALVHIVDDGAPSPRDPARIRAIPLYQQKVPAGAEVTGTGWGKTEAVEGHAPSAVLMKVDLRVMDTERCKQLPGYGPQKIHGNVICASHPQRSTCQGDSGGAIILTNGAPTVVGVVSWGKKRCSGDGQPGAYTRVESYLGWIKQAMLLDASRNSLP